MTTIAEVIRAAIPTADESLCDHILWGRTAYPFLTLGAKDIYRAAYRWRRAHEHGLSLCDFCDRVAEPHEYICTHCREALARAREAA